jgi:hypothetical protein
MRLSEWRAAAPHKDAGAAKVAVVVDPVLVALGTAPDPHGWIVWGDEPWNRYAILVPTDPGLVTCFVRVLVPGEGPRASGKLVRWNRVAIGELNVEAQQGHRLVSFQVEGQVLRGVDAEADRVAAFALRVIAAIDGRPLPPVDETPRARSRAAGSPATTGGRSPRKAAGASASANRGAPPTPAAAISGTAKTRGR